MIPVNEITSVTRKPPQVARLDVRKAQGPADEQKEADERKQPEEQDSVGALVGKAWKEERDQEDRAERVSKIDPPAFRLWIKSVHQLRKLGFDEGPAGANLASDGLR